jgi:hypothetical protein
MRTSKGVAVLRAHCRNRRFGSQPQLSGTGCSGSSTAGAGGSVAVDELKMPIAQEGAEQSPTR